MISFEYLSRNIVKVTIQGKVQIGDFSAITPQIDNVIQQSGKIRILVDGSLFKGWQSARAFQEHIHFVMLRHRKIQRVAIIPGALWQYAMINMAKRFVTFEMKIYKRKHIEEAQTWLLS
ncbi:MAG: STAS/SEC14 domain-containing protein [Alphaproteobacteria bacterium]|nr:STAS/SEC14 domain-containing protein [Alphaproteobacteria bacterium]